LIVGKLVSGPLTLAATPLDRYALLLVADQNIFVTDSRHLDDGSTLGFAKSLFDVQYNLAKGILIMKSIFFAAVLLLSLWNTKLYAQADFYKGKPSDW